MPHLATYRRAGPVATVTMQRPEKRNALSAALVEDLLTCLDRAASDPEVRVTVLTGAGTTFSAGADLAALEALQSATREQNLEDSALLARLFSTIYRHRTPVVARINGHAIAGGSGLAAVCDFSIAVEDARMGFTEVRIGFVPAIVSVFVVRKLGEAAARALLLTGRLIRASEAAEMGLITRAVAADELDAEIQALTRELAAETSGSAVARTKALLERVQAPDLDRALEAAVAANAEARETGDCRAGIAAFLGRKSPPWKAAFESGEGSG